MYSRTNAFVAAILLTGASISARGAVMTVTSTQPLIDFAAKDCNFAMPDALPVALFDFATQSKFETITGIQFTMTAQGMGTAVGEALHDQISLGLGAVDTGLKLNGFGIDSESSLTFSFQQGSPGWMSSAQLNQLVNDFNNDHMVLASLFNALPGGFTCLNLYSAFDTTLTLTGKVLEGQAVPEPGTVLIWAVAAGAIMGYRRIRGHNAGRRAAASTKRTV